MELELTISEPSTSELADICGLLELQYAEHRIALERSKLEEAVTRALEDRKLGLFLLARCDGRAVGLSYLAWIFTLENGGTTAWLEELYVVTEFRSQGLGAKLLERSIQAAAAEGCCAVDLEVDFDHARAARLYERHGFKPVTRSRWVLRL
jgi:GNAT superfamily N-acetyltransferase